MWSRSGFGSDLTTYNWTPAEYIRQQVADSGRFPLWWDTTMSGLPMVGNPGVRVFYPPMLLAILLPVPLFWGFAWVNAVSFWVAGAGMYALARWTMPVSRYAALAAAVMMMLTPRLSANIVGDMGYTAGLCWTPLTLACIRAAFDRRSPRWAAAAGLCGGLLLTLNFVSFLYLSLFVAAYAAICGIGTLGDRRGLRRLIGAGVVFAVVSLGTAALMVFPLLTYLPYQSRQALTLADANYLALPPPLLIDLLFPSPFRFPEWTLHVGLLPLALAVFGLRHPLRREVGWWGGVLLFSLVFALGTATPLYALIIDVVPGFSLMRVPARMLFFAVLALVALSALGVDAALARGRRIGRGWLAAGLLLALLTIAARLLMRRPDELDWLLGIPAALGLLVGLTALYRRVRRLRLILALCLVVELLPLAASYMTPAAFESIYQTPTIAVSIVNDRLDGDVFRVYGVQRELPDHILTLNRLQSVDGLNSFQFTHYADYMALATGCPLEAVTAAIPSCASAEVDADAYRLTQPDPELLGRLNVRYVLASFELPSTSPALRQIARDGNLRLYRNDAELPRAFAVEPAMVGEASVSDVIPATLHEASDGVFDLTVEVSDAMLLIISETWVPGWQAWVDGQPTDVVRANETVLGIPLAAGDHHVRVVFEPPAFAVGAAVSLVTMILAGGILLRRQTRG